MIRDRLAVLERAMEWAQQRAERDPANLVRQTDAVLAERRYWAALAHTLDAQLGPGPFSPARPLV